MTVEAHADINEGNVARDEGVEKSIGGQTRQRSEKDDAEAAPLFRNGLAKSIN
ncbi:hypothetical protein [Rhizobium yanglingense]